MYHNTANFFNATKYSRLSREAGALLHKEFALNCYVKLPLFFNDDSFAILKTEVLRIFEQHSRRRDFNMKHEQNTPRHLSTVSGVAVAEHSQLIPALYRDSHLIEFLCGIAGTQVHLVPDPFDRHVIHRLDKIGDVHGGHLDTYAFAFAIFIETPPKKAGGCLEFVPHSMEISDLDTSLAKRVGHHVGDCYFMKTNQSVHRVLPLSEEVKRTNLILTYADDETINIDISYSSQPLYG
ncbi:hypothetical protein [Nostoc sp. GT001]|uniref:HalD/BesD family halogenase n=1 Tax=Nostoc sp. GT001 TaxID=3056647 RepID=UPI0025AAFE38|nr:hypothetical protein [Nostoc sp. GT001]MDM9582351.1 hypothetical protein [Nostoc sp. GT001]